MAKPTNLDEYFQKMLVVRAKLKEWKNEFPAEMDDLAGVSADDLEEWETGAALSAYELSRIAAASNVSDALAAFDNASA